VDYTYNSASKANRKVAQAMFVEKDGKGASSKRTDHIRKWIFNPRVSPWSATLAQQDVMKKLIITAHSLYKNNQKYDVDYNAQKMKKAAWYQGKKVTDRSSFISYQRYRKLVE